MNYKLILILFLGFGLVSCNSQSKKTKKSIVLDEGWTFKGADTFDWMPARVPGTVHTDLLAQGIVEEPYYRTNEKDQQWVDKKDWIYQKSFDIPVSMLDQSHLELDFKGLDTYADVYLNDSLILSADNFFRSWDVPVKGLLKQKGNILKIYFHSPIKRGYAKLEANGYGYPAVNDQSEVGGVGEDKLSVFTRKPGYHFGWDWGPRFVTSGIWKDIELRAWSDIEINDAFYQQLSISEQEAHLQLELELVSDQMADASIVVLADGQQVAQSSVQLTKGPNQVELPFSIDEPKLWWTHNLGNPYLYDFQVIVELEDGSEVAKNDQVGIRNIEVVRDEDEAGRSFYFKLNGVPIFAKGANYIPQDLFLTEVSDEKYEGIIESAVAANMNMLRIWGGGIYEKDLFYDLCDEKGVLVWQDFMFACSMYPGDDDFLTNARLEAEENIVRLRNHASMALWCGNNENDVAWEFWGWKNNYNKQQQQEIQAAYDTLFDQILPTAVASLAPQTFYWPTSPYNGEGSHATYETQSGDIHYWGVWHGEHSFDQFDAYIGRFMSEFGFQSFPDFETVKTFTLPEDWDIESEVMASHQRSGIGNLRIRSYMDQYYHLPDNFEDMLYVGQVLQADGMRYGFEAHRRAMPYCMGSLYWQINDCWPVASWSGMDYYQKWKGLHYFAKKAFAPILVSPIEKKDELHIYIVSDQLEEIDGVLRLELLDFDGDTLRSEKQPLVIKSNTSFDYYQIPVKDLVRKGTKGQVVLMARVTDESGNEIASNTYYFNKVKELDLPEVEVEAAVEKVEGEWKITLSTDKLAKNVFLNFDESQGHFSDNYFDLLPGEQKTVVYRLDGGADPSIGSLKIKTIRDTY